MNNEFSVKHFGGLGKAKILHLLSQQCVVRHLVSRGDMKNDLSEDKHVFNYVNMTWMSQTASVVKPSQLGHIPV